MKFHEQTDQIFTFLAPASTALRTSSSTIEHQLTITTSASIFLRSATGKYFIGGTLNADAIENEKGVSKHQFHNQ
jgi:hypothetical protein